MVVVEEHEEEEEGELDYDKHGKRNRSVGV